MTTASTTSLAGIPTPTEALDAVRSLAEAAANQRGTSLISSELRLFEGITRVTPTGADEEISPYDLGRTYELLLAPGARRKKGTHLTPALVARGLVDMMPPAKSSDRVLDPAVGGAAFLLASADQLVEVGVAPSDALGQLFGVDIDVGAVAVAETALALWGLDHGVDPCPHPQIFHGDGLLVELPEVDRVVGNPPFLNQLRAASSHSVERRATLRDRWGDLVEAYTDDAWLFLATGLDTLAPDGSLALVQPVSILAARHGDAIRRYLHDHAQLSGLWVGRDRVFDAAVQVCGIVATKSTGATRSLQRTVGRGFETVSELDAQPAADDWGRAAATAIGLPDVRLVRRDKTIGDLATATAGFRDQFYGFVPYVADAGEEDAAEAPLVTVGMIDVLGLSWGQRAFKFAKREFVRPVVDLQALQEGDPTLSQWVAARRRPKLLMATQTRVAEVWVDESGSTIPATPVLSIEPHEAGAGADPIDVLWLLAAALSAPAVSAHFLATKFGTAMSLNSMKLAARDVLDIPLPADESAWQESAAILRQPVPDLAAFAERIGVAYGLEAPGLAAWWHTRVQT